MKIGILSDIHGNPYALKEILSRLDSKVEQYLFLGDLVGYYPFVKECISLLQERKVTSVKGNHDEICIQALKKGIQIPKKYEEKYGDAISRAMANLSSSEISYFLDFPEKRDIQIDGKKIRMMHGAPWDLLEGRVYPDFKDWDKFSPLGADILILGHTHYPFSKKLKEGLVLNSGSVGQPRDKNTKASAAILDTTDGSVEWVRVSFDPSALIADAEKHSPQLPYLRSILKT